MPEDPKDGVPGTPDVTPPPAATAAPEPPEAPTVPPPAEPAAVVAAPPDDDFEAQMRAAGVSDAAIATLRDQEIDSVEKVGRYAFDQLVAFGVKAGSASALVEKFGSTPAVFAGPATTSQFLPKVPDFATLLGMLKTGGVLKIDTSTVIAMVQAGVAYNAGLFSLPDKLAEQMLAFAETNDDPVDPAYHALKTQLTRRNYGDLFEAVPGFSGQNVTPKAKKLLFDRVNKYLWPAAIEFQQLLVAWMDAWTKASSNPAVLGQTISAALAAGRGGAGVLPASTMGAAPPTGGLRDTADHAADMANKVFAGEGVQIAAAVGFEAAQIRKSLSDTRLPTLVGAANRDQMLKLLGVEVSAADERLELDITQYVLSIFQLKSQPSGPDELNYLNELYMLGVQIPWDRLGGSAASGPTGLGGRGRSEL